MTDIEKRYFRITWIKAGSVLVGCSMICITIGLTVGDWKNWRKDIETRVTNVEKDTREFSTWKHDQQMMFIRNH